MNISSHMQKYGNKSCLLDKMSTLQEWSDEFPIIIECNATYALHAVLKNHK